MGRKRKEQNFEEIETQVASKIFTLNEYFSKFYSKKKLENIIRKWYKTKYKNNYKKTKNEWDEIIKLFHNEKEK